MSPFTVRQHLVIGQLAVLGVNDAELEVDRALLFFEQQKFSLYFRVNYLFGALVGFDLKVIQDLLDRDLLVVLIRERELL